MAKKYLLWTRKYRGKISEYCYMTIDEEGGWYQSQTTGPEFSIPAPPGMKEAIDMWFKIAFKYADLTLPEFLTQMGVEL